jgi:AcrR family transcriptional regulator
MARKPSGEARKTAGSAKSKSPRREMPEDAANRDRIVDAAMELVAIDGWSRLSLSQIADAAGLTLADVRTEFPVKGLILDAFFCRIDHLVLAAGPADADDSARDRLFDVMMRRFDALAPYKSGVASIFRDCLDPTVGMIGLPCFLRSMAWMLEVAGLSSGGFIGLARVKGLALVDLAATRAWLRDDSADMAKTMAALDKALRRAESIVDMLCGGRRDTESADA